MVLGMISEKKRIANVNIVEKLEEAKEDARTWEYPCDDLGNWDEDEIEIFEMILTKPLPKNRLLRNTDLPEYGKVIRKHCIFI